LLDLKERFLHTDVTRGEVIMNIPKKEHQLGNTTVIIHSPLVLMTESEREKWFKTEWENGNKTIKQIAMAVEDCYKD
jgi:hypothetical protein